MRVAPSATASAPVLHAPPFRHCEGWVIRAPVSFGGLGTREWEAFVRSYARVGSARRIPAARARVISKKKKCDVSRKGGRTLCPAKSPVQSTQVVSAAKSPSSHLEAEAEARFARLESGFRLLDSVAQLAPLLGLFGTVLGMISAFQALQEAGAQVDPSILAGGIWVALLTTAVGLAVAMPTALILSWFESRMDRERVFAQQALHSILAPETHVAPAHT